jgi:hypothetical protein
MYKPRWLVAAALMLAAVGGTIATSAGAQPDPIVVDYGACAFGDGTATVPVEMPISLQNTGGFGQGTYGLALHSFKSAQATATIEITGGTTTFLQLAYSQPAYYGDPYFAWLTLLPDIALDALPSGGSVLVTIDQVTTLPGEVVFPGQKGRFHFGPFHVEPGTFETSCLITAS